MNIEYKRVGGYELPNLTLKDKKDEENKKTSEPGDQTKSDVQNK